MLLDASSIAAENVDASLASSQKEELPVSAFYQLLVKVIDGSESPDELLQHPDIKRRGLAICQQFESNPADAEDLYQLVCVKVWRKVKDRFQPDETRARTDGGFFPWFRKIARFTFLNKLRKNELPKADERPEEVRHLHDGSVSAEVRCLRSEFEEFMKTRQTKHQLAVKLWLDNYSFREIEEILKRVGIECTFVSVRTWIKKSLAAFLDEGRAPSRKVVGL